MSAQVSWSGVSQVAAPRQEMQKRLKFVHSMLCTVSIHQDSYQLWMHNSLLGARCYLPYLPELQELKNTG